MLLDNYLSLIKPLIIQAANQAPEYKGFFITGLEAGGSQLHSFPKLGKVRTVPHPWLFPECLIHNCHFTNEKAKATGGKRSDLHLFIEWG